MSERADRFRAAADAYSAEINRLQALKRTLVAESSMPVDGIGFGESDVLIGGIPWAQNGTATRMCASAEIAASLNPKLQVLLVRDANLIDQKNLARLQESPRLKGYQLWLEVVRSSDAVPKVGFLMEEGSVVAVDGVRAEITLEEGL